MHKTLTFRICVAMEGAVVDVPGVIMEKAPSPFAVRNKLCTGDDRIAVAILRYPLVELTFLTTAASVQSSRDITLLYIPSIV